MIFSSEKFSVELSLNFFRILTQKRTCAEKNVLGSVVRFIDFLNLNRPIIPLSLLALDPQKQPNGCSPF